MLAFLPSQRALFNGVAIMGGTPDIYGGADIVLDFAGIKNGGVPFYRVSGVTYASAAAAGFTGTGTFNASGYTTSGTQKISGSVTFPQNFIMYVQSDQPTAANRTAYQNSIGSISQARISSGDYYFAGSTLVGTSVNKLAAGYSGGSLKYSVDGGTVTTGGAAPAATGADTLNIGNNASGNQPWSGPIKIVQIHLSALTDAQIVALAG